MKAELQADTLGLPLLPRPPQCAGKIEHLALSSCYILILKYKLFIVCLNLKKRCRGLVTPIC